MLRRVVNHDVERRAFTAETYFRKNDLVASRFVLGSKFLFDYAISDLKWFKLLIKKMFRETGDLWSEMKVNDLGLFA